MIVTRNWLEEWINLDGISNKDIHNALDSIGLEVDNVLYVDIPSKIVVGYVKECEKHPDADKLSVTKIDIGTQVVQIVCGAKNIKSGQYVPVATIGASFGDFKIKKAKLRGVESHGMVCSSVELGLPEVNDGILELDDSIGELVLGKEIREYDTLNDTVFDIELTANRGDCLSVYGIARDLSAYFKRDLKGFNKVELKTTKGIGRILEVDTNDIDSKICYKVVESSSNIAPDLNIQIKNILVGKKLSYDINDIIEYASHSVGVIIRAYSVNDMREDSDSIIKIELKKNKYSLDSVYLDNKEIASIGIESKNFIPNSKDRLFIIESSYINPDIISKLVYENKLKISDEVFYRTSRGTEYRTCKAQEYLQSILSCSCDLSWYSGEEKIEPSINVHTIDISLTKIQALIGQNIDKSIMISILKSLQFDIELSKSNEDFSVDVPVFRNDIKNIQDIAEEIIRIVGIDNIESKPLEFKEKNRINSSMLNYQKTTYFRNKSAFSGFFETLSFVFNQKNILEKYNFDVTKSSLELLNPISSELDTLRSTILINLLQSAQNNNNIGKKSIKLFEIGKVFDQNRNESTNISFLYSGKTQSENISNQGKPSNIVFLEFAKYISNIIGDFEICKNEQPVSGLFNPYEYGEIYQNNKKIGFISKLHISAQRDFDLEDTYVCECDFDSLEFIKNSATSYSKFQVNSRELSVLVPTSMSYSLIKDTIIELDIKELVDFYPIDIYKSKDLGKNMSLSIKFEIQSNSKTLTIEELDLIMQKILDTLKQNLNIELR